MFAIGFVASFLHLFFFQFHFSSAAFVTKAWQSLGESFTFPETEYPDIQAKQNVGITFSGGGDRSYTATMGYLGAFHELGYIDRIKYIAGSSGGSWATVVYSYYQHDDIPDDVMLGKIVFPEDIEYSELSYIEEGCVRAYVNSTYTLTGPFFSDWMDAIQAVYFTPAGILRGVPFTYDEDTENDIKTRNPGITSTVFQLLRGKFGNTSGIDTRPFPIIQGTLIGPLSLIPFLPSNRNYSLIEWTPLTAGVAYTSQFVYRDVNNSEAIVQTIGGLIEPFAFNTLTAPTGGLPAGQRNGTLTVPGASTTTQCDWTLASGTSSWALGCLNSASSSPTAQLSVGSLMYWSPSATSPTTSKFTTGDGAGVSNTNLISFIQRGVTTIIAFVNTLMPLQNSTHWNPATDVLTENDIDFQVPAWFGYIPADLADVMQVSFDLKHSHVFDSSEWLPMVTGLQQAQAIGKGNIISMTHTTVRNDHYGIQAGLKIKVVWVYLGRATQWEQQLNDEMKGYVIPEDDPDNQANTIDAGPFRHFPHYGTTLASETASKANLLADLTGWTIYQNQDLIRDALGLEPLVPSQSPTVVPSDDDKDSKSSNDDDNSFASSTSGIVTFVIVGLIGVGLILGVIYWIMRRPSSGLSKQDGNNQNNLHEKIVP